jgi:hypothetical protein
MQLWEHRSDSVTSSSSIDDSSSSVSASSPASATIGSAVDPGIRLKSVLRSGVNGWWFVSGLAWAMGTFRRNLAAEVLWDEANDIRSRIYAQFLEY